MKKIAVFAVGLAVLCLAVLATAQTPTPSPTAAPALDPALDNAYKMVQEGQAAVGRIKDFTCNFHKEEYKKGQLPKEVAFMKFRTNPRAVYMKWIGEEKKNQEIIWRKGQNDDKIRAHKGSFPDVTVNLEPDSWMAMKDNRHPIQQAGFQHTIELIGRDFKMATENPELAKIEDLGEKNILGTNARCFDATLDKDKNPKFYARKARICVSTQLKIPVRVQIWDREDGELRLVEDYGYENVKVNVGLTDSDFDPENKEYKF